MNTIDVDIETTSKVKLPKSGVTRYAMDKSTEVLCVCYSIDGTISSWTPAQPIPDCFLRPFVMVAHNAAFERAIWESKLVPMGFAKPVRYECTMVAALQRNLPGALVDVAPALGLTERKDSEGTKLMRKLCVKPSKDVEQADLERLIEYCAQDVRVEQAVHQLIPMREQELFDLDAKINARGIWVDATTCEAVVELIIEELADLNARLAELTGGVIKTGRQVGAMLVWLKTQGYEYDRLNAASVEASLAKPEGLTDIAIEALQIRQKLSLGSVGKYQAILNGVTPGSRVHDLVQFRGASQTGRYAGRRIQLQNLPRLALKDGEIQLLLDLFRARKRDVIRFLFGDVFYAAKQMIRPMFGSPRGLIVSDFAQIEARVVTWVSGQLDALEVFADETRKPYEEMAAKIYGVPVDQVTKLQRQVGKCATLGCGFGMGAAKFQATARAQAKVELTTEEAEAAVAVYREVNSKLVAFWWRLGDALLDCVRQPGLFFRVNKYITFRSFQVGDTVGVKLTLPSGRHLFFHQCQIGEGKYGDEVSFISEGGERVHTYGGKLCENLTQAIANDLLNHALVMLDKSGYDIVLHVHDEIVIENVKPTDVDAITEVMERVPAWAEGFPLKAETKFCELGRYTK